MTSKDIIHDIEAAVEKVAHGAVNIITDAAHNIAEVTQIIAGATHSTIEKLHSTHNQLKHLLAEKNIPCASEEIIKGRELPTIVASAGGEHVREGHNPAISKHLLNRVIFSRKSGEEDLSNAMNLQLEIESIKLVALPGSKPESITNAKPL
jgi:hypothetical protein